jgi:hypothetical protein
MVRFADPGIGVWALRAPPRPTGAGRGCRHVAFGRGALRSAGGDRVTTPAGYVEAGWMITRGVRGKGVDCHDALEKSATSRSRKACGARSDGSDREHRQRLRRAFRRLPILNAECGCAPERHHGRRRPWSANNAAHQRHLRRRRDPPVSAGSYPRSGRRGRRFKSCHPDQSRRPCLEHSSQGLRAESIKRSARRHQSPSSRARRMRSASSVRRV